VDLEIPCVHNGEHEVEVLELDDGSERLIEVNVGDLGEPLCNPVCFEVFWGAIGEGLEPENPSGLDCLPSWNRWHKVKGLIPDDGHILLLGSTEPLS
jgi:hypothetical protein